MLSCLFMPNNGTYRGATNVTLTVLNRLVISLIIFLLFAVIINQRLVAGTVPLFERVIICLPFSNLP